MNDDIMVSVVVLTYRHEKYIRQALNSILMQEVDFKYEIIVGDDYSPDNTRTILIEYKEKYPNIITLILRDENIGGTKNYYDACLHCKGKYIAGLDGDDYWIDTKKLQKQVDLLESNKDYIGVSHIIESRDLGNRCLGRHPEFVKKDMAVSIKDVLRSRFFSAAAALYRNFYKSDMEKYEKLSTAHRFVGDLTFCIYLLDIGKVYILNDCMSVYRVRKSDNEYNYNSQRNTLQISEDHIYILNVNNDYYHGKYDFTYLYNMHLFSAFLYCLKRGKIKEFIVIFNKVPRKIKIMFLTFLPVKIITQVGKKIKHKLKDD